MEKFIRIQKNYRRKLCAKNTSNHIMVLL
jgi:hypothetical protein